ncbi:site-specific DNA-methyltransferase [Rhodobacter capsulatus]
MTARLAEMKRVLKRDGCIFLHCDPTASHYLKMVLDIIFCPQCFVNEIIWQRSQAKGDSRRRFGRNHDVILMYGNGDGYDFHPVFMETDEEYASRFNKDDGDGRGAYHSAPLDSPSLRPNLIYKYKNYEPPAKGWRVWFEEMQRLDADGLLMFPERHDQRIRRKLYLSDAPGPMLGDVWTDIRPLQGSARESLGYPTQKPISLLQRILACASSEGDVILDPFCGCGTSIHAAEAMGRHWIGIDVAFQAMRVVEDRLKNSFPGISYDVFGIPTSESGARWLAENDPFKFEEWAVNIIGGMHSGKYRSDGGVDGSFYFLTGKNDTNSRGIISVKAGKHLNPGMIRDLAGTLHRERKFTDGPNAIAVFICAERPTKGMLDEARSAGVITMDFGDYPALQILSVEDIFSGNGIRVPFLYDVVSAAAAGRKKLGQKSLYLDPRELARQRQFLFSITSQATSAKQLPLFSETRIMPEPISKAG